MKKIYASLLIVMATCLTLHAQTKLTIIETMHSMSKGSKNAFVVLLPQYKVEDLKKDWERYLKDNGKVDIKETNGELSALNSMLDKVMLGNINHYALFDQSIDGPNLVAFFAINDTFVSTANNPVVAASIGKFMMDFAKSTHTKAAQNELTLEQDKLKALSEGLTDLEKKENESNKKIMESNNTIEKTNNLIVINKAEQDKKQGETELQQQKMSGVPLNTTEKKLQDKQINTLQNDKKDLIKKEASMKKDIETYNNTINVEQNKLPNLQAQQAMQKEKIQKQQEVIQKVQEKLEDIKK